MFGNKENLHHAYLIEGSFEDSLGGVLEYLENELNFSLKNNPDFYRGEFDTFGIDDGRMINELQSKKTLSEKDPKSFGSGKQIFIIKTNFITREAQNSLLKMFEEPTVDTHFFILMNSGEVLLPTLRSRLMIIKSEVSSSLQEKFVQEYLKANIGERMEMIKVFFGDPKSSKMNGQGTKKKIKADKSGAIEFLNELEKQLREKIDIKKATKEQFFVFEEIIKCRGYLNDRSPSVKMLLEYITSII